MASLLPGVGVSTPPIDGDDLLSAKQPRRGFSLCPSHRAENGEHLRSGPESSHVRIVFLVHSVLHAEEDVGAGAEEMAHSRKFKVLGY